MSPKATKTRVVIKVLDDAINTAQHISTLLNGNVGVNIFMDSRPLFETLGSMSQVMENALRQLVTYLT